jgi:hypothetical protein
VLTYNRVRSALSAAAFRAILVFERSPGRKVRFGANHGFVHKRLLVQSLCKRISGVEVCRNVRGYARLAGAILEPCSLTLPSLCPRYRPCADRAFADKR